MDCGKELNNAFSTLKQRSKSEEGDLKKSEEGGPPKNICDGMMF